MVSTGPISDDVDRPAAWSGSDSYDFEAEASRFAFPDLDVELKAGDEVKTDRGTWTFDRAVRNADGRWTLLYRGGMSHGPGYAAMKFQRGEWQLAAEYEGVQEL